MVTIFINSENIKTSDASRLLLNLADKTNLKRSDICDISEYVAISNLSIYYPWKKIHKKTIHLKQQLKYGMINSNYLTLFIRDSRLF